MQQWLLSEPNVYQEATSHDRLDDSSLGYNNKITA
jgi:hypothetical protein